MLINVVGVNINLLFSFFSSSEVTTSIDGGTRFDYDRFDFIKGSTFKQHQNLTSKVSA